jgi:hypothetical protein
MIPDCEVMPVRTCRGCTSRTDHDQQSTLRAELAHNTVTYNSADPEKIFDKSEMEINLFGHLPAFTRLSAHEPKVFAGKELQEWPGLGFIPALCDQCLYDDSQPPTARLQT